MTGQYKLPVFPLATCVCPGEVLPLHIFEPRYRALMAWCREELAAGRPGAFCTFAVTSEGEVSRIGGLMRLVRVLREYPDGRLDVLTACRDRVALTGWLRDTPCDCARVTGHADREADWSDALATQVVELHRQYLNIVTGQRPPDTTYSGRRSLAFHLAPTIGMGAAAKQRLIELTSENERLRLVRRGIREAIRRIGIAQQTVRATQAGWELQQGLYGVTSASGNP